MADAAAGAELGQEPVPTHRFPAIRVLYKRERKRTRATMTIDEIRENFELLEEWDDRYRYVIELGRTLEPMSEAQHSPENKVQGCVSQVWLSKKLERSGGGAV